MSPRRMYVSAALLAAIATVPATSFGERPSDPAHGYWLTENRKAIVEIAPCGAEACGRTVWVESAVDEAGAPKRDERNRPICGLTLVGGLNKAEEGTWRDGWVYNPKDGSTYSAEIRALSPSELEVRGYVGVSLLGKTQVWTRVQGDRGGCAL